MTGPLLMAVLAYVVGATPTSLWAGRWLAGTDIRRHGSGNLGATNAFRVLGPRVALPVLLIDVGKGWAPAALFPLLAPEASPTWSLVYGAAAVMGHTFSFWVGFRGGKGVATSAGVFLALAPWAVLVAFGVWVATVAASGYVSVGSILAALVLPLAVLLMPHQGGGPLLAFTMGLSSFVVWAHRSNIRRLRRGEEKRFRHPGRAVP